jgi:small-conductance mechanosensitive channel
MTLAASTWDARWHDFWRGEIGHWIVTKGLSVLLLAAFAVVATRLINWVANRISARLQEGDRRDAIVRSETVKHRQAVAAVISSVAVGVLYIVVGIQIVGLLGLPVSSLVAPAAVLGAALGFGAQRIVQDLLSGFFVITEKQYGFGDLVQLTVSGSSTDARGTVEDVTLRVTRLRNSDGEVFTIPNGQIVKTLNLSKDWARAVVDIPVPAGADLNRVNDALHEVSSEAMQTDNLPALLLDQPSVMGVESIGVDTVNVRMVARTLPGKQFDVGRELRELVVAKLRRAGMASNKETPDTVNTQAVTDNAESIEQSTAKPYSHSGTS